ncbi:MAG: hypothetical protein IKN73_01295 [Alphaproteobacteria bacterium]|nr:hypothetical protein [Alphaproteobacteria bacterium]
MKKIFAFFIICTFSAINLSWGAVSVKKASPIQVKKESVMDSTTSFLPAVIGLVENVKNLKTQQQQVTAECEPSGDEIETVNDLVREWAKIGDTDSDKITSGLTLCYGTTYESYMNDFAEGYNDTCYEVLPDCKDCIWKGYPKASSARSRDCSNPNSINCKKYSNIYEVFAKIPFSEEDYTEREAKKIAKLKEKYERCAPAKVKAAQRELYGNFLNQTLSGVGKTTGAAGTEDVIKAVSGLGGSGSLGSLLPSLSGVATQMLDK